MDMLCAMTTTPLDLIFIISISTLVSGIFFLNITGIIICKHRRICCFAGSELPPRQINLNELTEEQRDELIKQENERKLKLLNYKIKK
jgi:hypothetical protein